MRLAAVRPAATALLALAAACASGRGGRPFAMGRDAVASPNSVVVEVQSNYVGPLDLYLVSEGVATRIGDVSGPTVERFQLDPDRFDLNDLRIVATPVGGYGRASTGTLNVRRGSVVQFNIANNLRQSSVFIR